MRDKIESVIEDCGDNAIAVYRSLASFRKPYSYYADSILSLTDDRWYVDCKEGQEMDCCDCSKYTWGANNDFKCQDKSATIQEILDNKATWKESK